MTTKFIGPLAEAGYKPGDAVRLLSGGGYNDPAFYEGAIGTIGVRPDGKKLGVILPDVENGSGNRDYPWFFFADEIEPVKPGEHLFDTDAAALRSFFDDQSKSERWFSFAPLFAGLVVLILAGLVALFSSDAHSASFSARGGGFSSARSFSTSRSYSAPRPSYSAPKPAPAPAPVIKRETTIINRTYNNGGGYSGGGSSGFLPGFLGGYLGGTLAQPHYTPAPSAPIIVTPQAAPVAPVQQAAPQAVSPQAVQQAAPQAVSPQAVQQYTPQEQPEDTNLGFWGWIAVLGFFGLCIGIGRRVLNRK